MPPPPLSRPSCHLGPGSRQWADPARSWAPCASALPPKHAEMQIGSAVLNRGASWFACGACGWPRSCRDVVAERNLLSTSRPSPPHLQPPRSRCPEFVPRSVGPQGALSKPSAPTVGPLETHSGPPDQESPPLGNCLSWSPRRALPFQGGVHLGWTLGWLWPLPSVSSQPAAEQSLPLHTPTSTSTQATAPSPSHSRISGTSGQAGAVPAVPQAPSCLVGPAHPLA